MIPTDVLNSLKALALTQRPLIVPAHLPLTIRLGRIRLYQGTLCQPGLFEFTWPWPEAAETVTLLLRSSETFIPSEHGMGADERELSVGLAC